MREYDIKMLIRKVMNDNGGNPYHDEKGRFTFSLSSVGANFEKSEDFFKRLTKINENLNKVREKQMELLNERVQYEETYDRAVKELGFTDKDAISKKFGSSVNDEREVLLAPNTELKFTDVKLTSEGILIECGFISNDNERYKLKTEEYQLKLSKIITEGIITYYS